MKRAGPKTLPCKIPLMTSDSKEKELFTRTCCVLRNRRADIQNCLQAVTLNNFFICRWYGTESNAILKSI